MKQSHQTFENKTDNVMFITVEPWCWRYRLKPGDVLEVRFSLECRQESWSPLEVQVGSEGANLGIFIFVNGDGETDVLLNGSVAVQDWALDKMP